jgi:methylmalonyl-CoA/ethylmalonyl-CoA epimerase
VEKNTDTGTQSWTLTQVGVVVRDVNKVVERLSSLGIGPFEPKNLPPDRNEWFRGKPMDADFNIQAARVGNVELELIQPLKGDSPHKEFLETKGEGIQHVMFAVDDFEKELDRLTKQGVEVLLRAKFPGGSGVACLDLGAANFVIELVQKR